MSINSRGTYAEINLEHLRQNIKFIRSKVNTNAFFCPMIKADGYGHGDVIIGRELERQNVSAVGVISIEEGISLRQAGLQLPILTFGSFDDAFAREVIEFKLTPVISSYSQLESLKPYIDSTIKIHLKFNTGMNRLGFTPEQATELSEKLDPAFEVQGICTHFLNGEDADTAEGFCAQQLKKFSKIESAFIRRKPLVHYLNSAAALVGLYPPKDNILSHSLGVGTRPGISIYGISPVTKKHSHNLKPVMSIHSRIELIQKVKSGDVVSYGPQWKATRDSTIGVIPIGYADGYLRTLTNKSEMLYKGVRVPVCGIVCMDYCMVDLTDIKTSAQIGDKIVVIGEDQGQSISVSELAQKTNTIPYEILTRIGKRVTRTIVNSK